MNQAYFSYFTLFFYYAMAIVLALMVKKIKGRGLHYSSKNNNLEYCSMFLLLLCFAVFRKVGINIGGADSVMYEQNFIHALTFRSRFDESDVGFGFFMKIIRYFTDSVFIFRVICYSLIAGAYVLFIKYLCPKGVSSIPFLILIWPYIKSFNTMRNSMAIAVFLLGIILLYKEKKLWGVVLILLSAFVHRMSIIYVPIIPFIYLFRTKINKLSGKQLIICCVIVATIGCILARLLQSYIISNSLLDSDSTADSHYIQKTVGGSILDSWPMLFPHLLLLIGMGIFSNRLPKVGLVKYIKVLVTYDMMILPPALLLGMWRASEYLYISSVIMWSILIPIICQLVDKPAKYMVRIIFTISFIFLLYIRFSHEWEECKIMPYLFYWT